MMAIGKALFSSRCSTWETPQHVFDELDSEFHFTLDVCATSATAKCKTFHKPPFFCEDGLSANWSNQVCWMNPPYGRNIGQWICKAYEESRRGATVVGLLPVRTDTVWFHKFINGNTEIRFVRGRLKFGESKNGAPFPSMVVVWRPSPQEP